MIVTPQNGDSVFMNTPYTMRYVTLPWARKNWLFAGSDTGGGKPPILYSLMPNVTELKAWMRYVLGNIQSRLITCCTTGSYPFEGSPYL